MPLITTGALLAAAASPQTRNIFNNIFRAGGGSNSRETPPAFTPTENFPIALGQSNVRVRALQRKLMSLSPANEARLKAAGAVTDNMGPATASIITGMGYNMPLSEGDYNAIMRMGSTQGQSNRPNSNMALPDNNRNILIVGGLISVVVAFLFFKKRK